MDISSASRVHKNEWTKSGVRFFRTSDVVASYNKKKNTEAFISQELYEELSLKSGKVSQSDILITGGGSIGIPFLIKDEEPLYFKDADLIWLKNSGKLNGYFLFTFFITNSFRQYLGSISHIGTISHYTIEQAKVTPISLPNEEEQNKIGTFFEELDNTIALHLDKHQQLNLLKKRLLKELFPQHDGNLPHIRFANFNETWEQRKLGEEAEFFDEKRIPIDSEKRIQGRYPYYGASGVIDYVDCYIFDGEYILLAEDGANIITRNSPIAYITEGKFWLNNHAHIMKMKFGSNLFLLQSLEIQNYEKFNSGTAQPKLNGQIVKNMIFNFPGYEEQTKVGNFFKNLDDTITLHQQKIDKMQLLKKVLLNKMFI